MRKMKTLIILFLTYISIGCAFFVPTGFLKLSCQDNPYVLDRNVVKPEVLQSTHTGKIKVRSINNKNEDFKRKLDETMNELVLKDLKPEGRTHNERSFVYLKQKHRTPIINVVHGTHQGKKSSFNEYSQEFIKKPFQSYIEKFLKDSSFFNQNKDDEDAKKKLARLQTNKGHPRNDNRKEDVNDIDKSINEKLKIVEFLKPPLLRCDNRNENRNEISQTSHGNNNDIRHDLPYPVHPTRKYHHHSTNNNQRGNNFGKPEKESLCSHIYQSHIKDCVHRIFGKDTNENALSVLAKCIKDI